ncbi:MAG: YlxR family protein [Eubacteriales bacterium]|nr:YlxR family protein [Eubacteriales bacterium]
MANNSHTVERICCVCRKLQPIDTMTRVVRVDGAFFVQGTKRLNGRGAHVCPACLQSPNLSKALSRSFKAPMPAALIDQLVQK